MTEPCRGPATLASSKPKQRSLSSGTCGGGHKPLQANETCERAHPASFSCFAPIKLSVQFCGLCHGKRSKPFAHRRSRRQRGPVSLSRSHTCSRSFARADICGCLWVTSGDEVRSPPQPVPGRRRTSPRPEKAATAAKAEDS